MELRPRMLKDCLLEDSNSSSSNGFKSIPRRPLLDPFSKRKQSNALKAVINAVKNLRSNSVKSSLLQRSLSRPLSPLNQASITVIRVKDIVRWNSSKDLHEDISHPELSPPHLYTTKTTTGLTTCSSSTTTGTSRSSWCESEFLQSSWGSNVEECGEKESCKNNLQCGSEDSCTAITVADTEVGPEFENEYKKHVSVFEIQEEEDDEASNSSFGQCLDNVERTKEKLMQTIQRFDDTLVKINPFSFDELVSMDEESCIEEEQETCDENFITIDREIEEKAIQLWKRVKERHAIWIHEEHLIMDYFRDELMQSETYRDIQHFENELVGEAKGWLQGQREPELERGTSEERRCACVRDIENEKRMKEEHEEVVLQIEDGIFNVLVNETLNAVCAIADSTHLNTARKSIISG